MAVDRQQAPNAGRRKTSGRRLQTGGPLKETLFRALELVAARYYILGRPKARLACQVVVGQRKSLDSTLRLHPTSSRFGAPPGRSGVAFQGPSLYGDLARLFSGGWVGCPEAG